MYRTVVYYIKELTISTEIQINLGNIKQKINKTAQNNITLKVGFLTPEMAQIAVINEYGATINVTPKMRGWFFHNFGIHKSNKPIVIPPRPFMTTTIKNYKNKWAKGLKVLLESMPPEQALSYLGERMRTDIMDTIISHKFTPNAPFTIMKKGRDKPLIDSGDMLNSIKYKVSK